MADRFRSPGSPKPRTAHQQQSQQGQEINWSPTAAAPAADRRYNYGGGNSMSSPSSSTSVSRRQYQRQHQREQQPQSMATRMATKTNHINDPPMQPKLFPKPIMHRGIRNARIHVKRAVDDGTIGSECVWLIRSDTTSPRAYRKLESKPAIKSPSDTALIVTCVVLTRIPNTNTYQEPPRPNPRQYQSYYDYDDDYEDVSSTICGSSATGDDDDGGDTYRHLVLVKKYKKRSNAASVAKSSYDYIKDAYVLQTCSNDEGGGSSSSSGSGVGSGILQALDVIEDERYVYIVTQYPKYSTLDVSASIGTPPSTLHVGGGGQYGIYRREQRVKHILRQLLRVLQRLHKQHLICHCNLCPHTITCTDDDISSPTSSRSTASSLSTKSNSRLFIDDFAMSLMYPTSSSSTTRSSSKQRHWIIPQDIIPKDKQYTSPEVYQRKKFDGPSTDVWGCGVILFNLLTGCKLYNFPSQLDPIYYHFIVNGGLINLNNINEYKLNTLLNNESTTATTTTATTQSRNSGNRNDTPQRRPPAPPPSSQAYTQQLIEIIFELNTLSSDAKSMMNDMLQIDPTERISIDDALNHPWLIQ